MFEYGNKKTDPVTIAIWCSVVPFGLFWAFHRSLMSAFLVQASIITIGAFFYGLKIPKAWENIDKRWFIKSILVTTIVIHPLLLAVAWYLDANYPILIAGAGSVFVTGFVAAVIEMIVVGAMMEYFGKLDAEGCSTASPSDGKTRDRRNVF
jgi:hypothetical protein